MKLSIASAMPTQRYFEQARQERNWLLFLIGPADQNGKRSKKPTGIVASEDPNERVYFDRAINVEEAAVYTFDEAAARLKELRNLNQHCIGYLPRPGSAMVIGDLDNCRDPQTGEIEPWAMDIINRDDTYAEVSVSETGIRLLMARDAQDEEISSGERNGVGLFANGGRAAVITFQSLSGRTTDVMPSPHIKAALMERRGRVEQKGGNPLYDGLEVTLEETEAVLMSIPNDGRLRYDQWIQIGHVLKLYHDNDAGKELWLRWSSLFPEKPTEKPERMWERGLKPNGSVTFGSLIYEAKRINGDQYPQAVRAVLNQRRIKQALGVMPEVQGETLDTRLPGTEETTTSTELIRQRLMPFLHASPLELDTELERIHQQTGQSKQLLKQELRYLKRLAAQQVVDNRPVPYAAVDGVIVPNYQSVLAYMHETGLNRHFAWDEFANKPILWSPLPNDLPCSGPRPLEDRDYLAVFSIIQQQQAFVRVTKASVIDAVDWYCKASPYHPIRNYLNGLMPMGTNLMDEWLVRFLGATGHPEYLRQIGRKWLISAVARVMDPGCQVDHALILEGPQGVGKSSALRILAGDEFFGDSLPSFHERAASEYLQGHWIIEMSELTSVLRSEIEDMRSFLTRRMENYRPAYGRQTVSYKRQCVFAGSTNRDDYLKDASGERRFWIVSCGKCDLKGLSEYRDILWAEAVQAYLSGENWRLERDIEDLATEVQKSRVDDDPWYPMVAKVLGGGLVTESCVAHVMDGMSLDKNQRNASAKNRIGTILRQMGYSQIGRIVDGRYQGARKWTL